MGKINRAVSLLLLAAFILASAGAFFMGKGNAILVFASEGGAEADSAEGLSEDSPGDLSEDAAEGEPEGGGTVSGNGVEDISCICTEKCASGRINAVCAVCAEDYEKCEYIPPKVRISISQPDKWYRYGNAEVKVSVEDMAHSPDFMVEKVEARIGQSGSYADITDSMKVRITEDCSVYVLVMAVNGKVYEENRSIQCFDKDKPSLNAGISGGMLTVQAMDRTSGVKAVYVNGQEFTDLTGGTLQIRLRQADSVLENFTVQAMDMAGNVSDVYTIKNPYYKNPEVKEEEGSVSELPKSVLPTQPAEARAAVVDYVNTAEDAAGSKEEKAQTKEEQPGKAQPGKVDGASPGEVLESSRSLGKEFYTIRTDNGKVFYLIIDNTQSGDNVYFLTEISENDLLNVTDISYQVMEGSGAATESALPEREEEKEAEEEKDDEGKEEETEPDAGLSADDGAEKRSPALAYGILVLLGGAVAGGIYFFRTYRREGEDFVDDDEEEDEEEIYEKEDVEKDGSYDESGMDGGIAGDDDFFYEDGSFEEE